MPESRRRIPVVWYLGRPDNLTRYPLLVTSSLVTLLLGDTFNLEKGDSVKV